MVLDKDSANQADSFSDSIPASDEDPYSSSEAGSDPQYHIDIPTLPKPIPIIGPILGYHNELFTKIWSQKIKAVNKTLGRAATQDEAGAIAYWTAKQVSLYSYGTPIGIAGGIWRAWGTKETFRFPFWQPNLEKFQSAVFPHSRVPLLGGNRASLAWHAVRVLAYGVVGKNIGNLLFGSYSFSVATVGEASDPRLQAFTNAIRQRGRRKQGGLPGQIPTGPVSSTQQGGAGMENKQQQDDASPTGGLYGNDGSGMRQDEGGKLDEPYPSNWPKPGHSKTQTETPKVPLPTQRRDTQASQSDDFDDSSPTSGQGTTAGTAQQSGSAWERIRRVSKSGGQSGSSSSPSNKQEPSPQSGESAWAKLQNNTEQEQRQGSTTGDSFTFSKSDEERSLAKDEAQKEFDARVERERRGGDFNSGGGNQKRW